MKKLFMLLIFVLVLSVATACGSNGEDSSTEDTNASGETKAAEDSESTENADDTGALLKNHVGIANTIRAEYTAVNDYISALDSEDIDAETLKEDAITAADEAISKLDSYELVEADQLTDQTVDTFKSAVKDVKAAFEAYKSAIESGNNDFKEAEDKIAVYTEKLAPVFEAAGLSSSADLATELQ
ncbi:hypothetical protein GCM10008986_00040 [Salinibacillus aidingensis]|uniref:Lipoprotein n=1 Tax=Salinibacillus aidingensis TaxID=237684 RepID=A0ABP3KJQ2_9BACI